MTRVNRSLSRRAVVGLGVVVAMAGLVACQATPPSSITLEGHGSGHGRGMGQYGAYGYAVDDGWSGTAILDHFYGGTVTKTVPDSHQSVYLTAQAGHDLVVMISAGDMTTSANSYASTFSALKIHRVDSGHFELFTGSTCSGPWSQWTSYRTTSTITIRAGSETSDDPTQMLQLCGSSGTRYYRGDLLAEQAAGTIETVNYVDTEDLVRSVIAHEASPGWADAGNGRGAAMLRAQAVASRSYAEAGDTRFAPWATTCDSTTCQVYYGYGTRASGSSTISLVEDPRTDTAVATTPDQVRVFTSNGTIATTEFSSSSGGYSAGGTFPAVVDAGDATSINPNHNWTVTFSQASLAKAVNSFAGKNMGSVLAIDFLSRNGYGDWGGRVNTLEVECTGGNVVMTGSQFQSLFGLRSTWFTVES